MSSGIGPYPWRVLLVLWIAGVAATPLIWPYIDGLFAIAPNAPSFPDDIHSKLFIRNLVLATILIAAGLFCVRRLGLATPYLDSWLYGRGTPEPVVRLLTRSVGWALGVCAGVFAVDLLFSVLLGVTHPAPEIHARIPGVEAWRGIPISFYASITEELVYRLFLMSVLAWGAISVMTRGRRNGTRYRVLGGQPGVGHRVRLGAGVWSRVIWPRFRPGVA